jgi:membrane protease YdiL (CAAX protease family)
LSWTIGSTVFGAAAAASVVLTESLWPAIIAHALYDMTVHYVFAESGDEERVAPGSHGAFGRRRRSSPSCSSVNT